MYTNRYTPWRTALTAGVVIVVLNLLVLGLGTVAGADMIERSTGAPRDVGAGLVALMSFAPALLGGLTLWLASWRGPGTWRAVGWLGLAIGLLTVPLPFTAGASLGTALTLAGMHVVAGVTWFFVVGRRSPRPSGRLTEGPARTATEVSSA